VLITAVLAVLFLPLVTVIAWKCWSLPPVPVIRIWSLSLAGMALAMVLQSARADFWKMRSDRLRRSSQSKLLQSQQWRQLSSSIMYRYSRPEYLCPVSSLLHADVRSAFPCAAELFGFLKAKYDFRPSLCLGADALRPDEGRQSTDGKYPKLHHSFPEPFSARYRCKPVKDSLCQPRSELT